MEKIRTLIISDYLNHPFFKHITWESDYLPSLEGYHVIVIDMSFEINKSYRNKSTLLYKLKKELDKENFLHNNDLILIVICGSQEESLKYDAPYDPYDNSNENFLTEDFKSYDFLGKLIPNYIDKFEHKIGENIYSVASIPVSLYLTKYNNIKTYIKYRYDPVEDKFLDFVPLAKMRETGNTYVAFECKQGRGLSIILTPYDIEDINNTIDLLIKICKSYYKKRTGFELINKINNSIPTVVKEDFIEAITCFNYDLYRSTVIMCRRTLEASAIEKGINNKNLKSIIKELENKNIINAKLAKVAHNIRVFGNWGAHKDLQINEKDASDAIKFLETFIQYVYILDNMLEEIEKR